MLRFLFNRQALVSSSLLRRNESVKKFFSSNFDNGHQALDTVMWKKMNRMERIRLAMNDNDPKIAEIAYYKGLGFKELGRESSGEAISAFNKAIELDEGYKAIAEREVASIYEGLGMPEKALSLMTKALDDVLESSENLNTMKEENSFSASYRGSDVDKKENKKTMRALV